MNDLNTKKKISIFTKPYWFSRVSFSDDSYLTLPGSSFIRGEQIAKYLGAKYNPKNGYENDVCIYVKSTNLDEIKEGSYVDIIDGQFLIEEVRGFRGLRYYPKLKIIVSSLSGYEFLKANGFQNELILIPQHHCNFERLIRQRKEITTVGTIGVPVGESIHPVVENEITRLNEIEEKLKAAGLKFIHNFRYQSRQNIVDFYNQIDIQIAWAIENRPLKNPLKIINAASFGIPTVAHRQIGYKEFEGNYIGVETIDAMIAEVEKLRDKDYYNKWATKIIEPAEKYHISRIAELYKQLT